MGMHNSKWYVTYWVEYPIYEPAEGGYYYAGRQNLVVHAFNTFRKAKRYFAKAAADFKEYVEIGGGTVCTHGTPEYRKGSFTCWSSRYIGEGNGVTLTFGEPPRERGWHPYS